MPLKPFYGVQTVTGAAQPIFGTALTAAVNPPPDQFSGNLGPGSNQTQVEVTVTSTRGFFPGSEVLLGASSAFLLAPTTKADRGVVKSVVSATVLLVQGLQQNHASGEWCLLNEVVGSIRIHVLGTNILYLGAASSVDAADESVIDVLPASSEAYTISTGTTQPLQTSEFWGFGTAADTFVASYQQV